MGIFSSQINNALHSLGYANYVKRIKQKGIDMNVKAETQGNQNKVELPWVDKNYRNKISMSKRGLKPKGE